MKWPERLWIPLAAMEFTSLSGLARSLGTLPEEGELESQRKESLDMDNSIALMDIPPMNDSLKKKSSRKKSKDSPRDSQSDSGVDNHSFVSDSETGNDGSRRQRKCTAISLDKVVRNEKTYDISDSSVSLSQRRKTYAFEQENEEFKDIKQPQRLLSLPHPTHMVDGITEFREPELVEQKTKTIPEEIEDKSSYILDLDWAKGKEGDSDDDDSAFRESDSLLPESEVLSSEKEEEKRPFWDVFRIIPVDNMDDMEHCYSVFRKLFKVFTILLVFIITLLTIVVTRGTVLFAASNMERTATLQCKRFFHGAISGPNNTLVESEWEEVQCLTLPNGVISTPNDSCLTGNNQSGSLGDTTETFTTRLCETVDLRWVWSLFLMMTTPYFLEFIRSVWIVCFRQEKSPTWHIIFIVGIIETLHVTGLCLMLFYIFPEIDDVIQTAVIACGVGFVPSLLRLVNRPVTEPLAPLKIILDILAFLGQVSLLAYYPLVKLLLYNEPNSPLIWCVPLSLTLMSFGWWDNYIESDSRLGKFGKRVVKLKEVIRKTKTKIYLVVSLWKCVLAFGLTIAFGTTRYTLDELFGFLVSECDNGIAISDISNIRLDWVFVWVINACTAMVGYFFFRSAVKVHIQEACYALPLMLGTPIVVCLLVASCEMWTEGACALAGFFPPYMSWKCYDKPILKLFTEDYLWICIIWWISQIWITRHIWFPKCETLAKTDKLFMRPLYDAVMTEQWYLHNRRSKDEVKDVGTSLQNVEKSRPKDGLEDFEENVFEEEDPARESTMKEKVTPTIYICATMWHETENEMIQILRSIFRLDKDQAIRRNNIKYLKHEDPDYYEFEAHIFFDNAFEEHTLEEHDFMVNTYVTQLVQVIDTAATLVHEVDMHIDPPIKYPTPYGGRLEWRLPGSNRLIAHLKDKAKIKIKKRWSQVMYMYYFLGYRLWGRVKDLPLKRKQMLADHTFLLALDGDVDFQPQALSYLVDLMKRNTRRLGAACGRIHPIGSGPLAWYQKFEYALGHWMQKSTEHVLGCVLCSPGCFSLFRGSALMDDNVMRMYATRSTQPLHYVQYDQGEDRWLCTLLLQQGYRVEYGAASDALTFCPESFNEFYNQRRRWMPSTMANIMDLLMSWQRTIKVNENISMLYIIYQTVLFVSSILGAGSIFMMIVGAVQVAVAGAITVFQSFVINLIPVVLFILLCFCTKSKTQLWVASILTILYALVQMMVLVGLIVTIALEGPCSPVGVFFFYVSGTFILSAIIHPQEFFCLVHGLMYFLVIPSMYMLLMIFSITNINDVSWGTREVVQTRTEKKETEMKKMEQQNKIAQKNGDLGFLASILKMGDTGPKEDGFTFSIGNLWKCVWCPRPVHDDDEKLNKVLKKLEEMEEKITEAESGGNTSTEEDKEESHGLEDAEQQRDEVQPETEEEEEETQVRDEMVNPSWIEDEAIGKGENKFLDPEERMFFRQLVDTYLMPPDPTKLVENKKQEEKIAEQLKELKNNMSLAYIMMNAIFVVVVFTLQANVDLVNIPWPCGDDLKLEPIGMLFLVSFGIIMLLQTLGMVAHRMSTFLHIVATTKIRNMSSSLTGNDETMALGKELGNVKETQEDQERTTSLNSKDSTNSHELPPNVGKLDKSKRPRLYDRTIDAAYRRRFEAIMEKQTEENTAAPEDIYRTVIGRPKGRHGNKAIKAIATLQRRHLPQEEIRRPRAGSSTSAYFGRIFRKKSSVTQPPNPAGLRPMKPGLFKRRTDTGNSQESDTPPADYDQNPQAVPEETFQY